MQIIWRGSFASIVFGATVMATGAFAQTPMVACESQQSLEQVLDSDDSILPDDCRDVSIAQLDSEGRALCLIDFSQDSGGLIDDLRGAAVAEQWWVDCTAIDEQTRPAQ